MEEKNKLSELIQAVGATAELTKLQHDSFLRVGFTPVAALELTKTFMQTQIMIAASGNRGEKEAQA